MATAQKKLAPGDDKEMISNPSYWPNVVLPLKKPGWNYDETGKSLGVLFEEPRDKGWRIFHVNLFMLSGMSAADMAKVEKTVFASVDDMLAAGWMVD